MILTGKAAKFAENVEDLEERLNPPEQQEFTEGEQIAFFTFNKMFSKDDTFRKVMVSVIQLYSTTYTRKFLGGINFSKSIKPLKEDKMQYKIKSWIPCEEEEPQFYPSLEAARRDLQELEGMQPENHYEIHAVEGSQEVECFFCGKKEKMSVAQDTWIASFWHNEFVKEEGPACEVCSKRLVVDPSGEYFLPLGR